MIQLRGYDIHCIHMRKYIGNSSCTCHIKLQTRSASASEFSLCGSFSARQQCQPDVTKHENNAPYPSATSFTAGWPEIGVPGYLMHGRVVSYSLFSVYSLSDQMFLGVREIDDQIRLLITDESNHILSDGGRGMGSHLVRACGFRFLL